jgi:hypothetical protein
MYYVLQILDIQFYSLSLAVYNPQVDLGVPYYSKESGR